MSEFIAESVIIVKANTKPFSAELVKVARAAEKTPVTITVRASLTGFRADLLRQLKTSTRGVTVKVIVRPDLTGFRAELIAATKAAARGVTVPVAVTPARATGAAAVAATTAAAPAAVAGAPAAQAAAATVKATNAEKALADALNASAFARKRVLGDMTAQEKSMAILVREEAALKAAEKAVTQAIAEQNVALEAQARALVRTQAAAVEKRRGVISRRQAQIDAPQQAQQQARAQVVSRASAISAEQQALVARGEAAQTKIVERETKKRTQISEAFEQREAELRNQRAQAIEQALARERQATIAQSQQILGARARQENEALKQRQSLENELGRLRRRTTQVPVAGTSTDEINSARRLAQQNQTAAIKAADAARRAGLPTLTAEFEKIEAENTALREQLALQRRLNALREQARTAALPQLGRTPAAGFSKEAAAAARAEAAAEALATDARRAGAGAIADEANLLQSSSGQLKRERADLAQNTESLAKNARARTDIKRATQSQLLTFAGLRGAALSAESAFLFAAAGTIAFVKAVQSAAALQTELNTFQATAGATADQMQRVSDTARELGRDISLPGVNAQDAAQALTELSKAGLSVEDSIDGARGVLQLATAASIDNAEATELAASALNAFGLAGADATHVADVLANAANDSQGSIVDIGIALRQSAAVGRQAGLSFEQVSAALTIFARNGLVGSDAGTSLRTALIRLINPTAKAQAVIDKLGLHLRTASGAINIKVFDEFREKTQQLTAAQRDQALAIIFGQDAIRGAAILARTGADAFDEQVGSLNKAGTAAQLAAARTAGLAGAMENLKNQLTDAGTGLGESLSPALVNIANVMADAVRGAQSLFDAIGDVRAATTKPIEVVVKFIEDKTGLGGGGGGGGGGGASGLVNRLKNTIFAIGPIAPIRQATEDVRNFQEALVESSAQLEDLTGADLVPFRTVKQAQKDVQDLVAELNKAKGGPRVFNETITQLQDIQKGMEGGTAETKVFAKSLQGFIDQLQQLSGQPDIDIPIKIPIEVLEGTFQGIQEKGHSSGIITAEEFSKGFLPPFGSTLKDAGKTLEQAFGPAADRAAADIANRLRKALVPATQGENQALGFSRQETQARIRGDVEGQIRAIEGTASSQRKIIDAINKATGGAPTGKLLERRTKAEGTLADALDRIQSLQDQQAAEVKQKASDIKQARDDADQAVLDAFAPRRDRLDIAATKASEDESLKNDIAVQRALKAAINDEIRVITQTVKDQKTRRDAIRERLKERATVQAQIKSLKKQAAEQAKEDAKDARDLITTRIGKQLQLAQIVGQKDPILNAFNRAIKDAQLRVKNWKKLGLVQIDEKIALEQLKKDRKAFLEELQGTESSGLTIAQFLTENSDLFKSIAGNIGAVGRDPFSGFDFSSGLVKTLNRLQSAAPGSAGGRTNTVPALTPGVRTPIGGGLDTSLERLIKALDRNTEAKEGNTSTGVGLNARARDEVQGRFPLGNRFWENRLARQQVEDNI